MNCIRITFLILALISFGLIVVGEAGVIQNLATCLFGSETQIIPIIQSLAPSLFEISVTVAIVEWLLERQRRREWKKVRSQIVSALSFHIANIASEYQMKLFGPGLDLLRYAATGTGMNEPSSQTAAALQTMLGDLKRVTREIPWLDELMEQTEELHSTIRWDVAQIRHTLLPRLLAIEANDPELTHLLGALDAAERD